MTPSLLGGCYCGAIRYKACSATFHRTNCHCTICRRTTGAPYVAWFTVRRDQFQLTQGVPVRFASSATGVRQFCGRCGTQLTFESAQLPDEIDITTSSLDEPQSQPPQNHTYVSNRIDWVQPGDDLPQYAGALEPRG